MASERREERALLPMPNEPSVLGPATSRDQRILAICKRYIDQRPKATTHNGIKSLILELVRGLNEIGRERDAAPRCKVCSRELTDQQSIKRGLGPECNDKWGTGKAWGRKLEKMRQDCPEAVAFAEDILTGGGRR